MGRIAFWGVLSWMLMLLITRVTPTEALENLQAWAVLMW